MDDNLSQAYQYRPLQSDRHIRLLHILDPDSHGGNKKPILYLVHMNIDTAPPFEAVSYVWGDPTPVGTLHLSISGDLGVAHNLNEALPYLIKVAALGTRYLWIDAICINQADHTEKDSQIPMMREIYTSAKYVLAWLGPDPPDDEYTENHGSLCSRIADAMDIVFRHSDTSPKEGTLAAVERWDNWIRDHLKDIMTKEAIPEERYDAWVSALDSITNNPFFTRAWTFQEWVLPEELFIVIGSHRFEPELLPVLSIYLNTWRLYEDKYPSQARLLDHELVRLAYQEQRKSNNGGRFGPSMLCRIMTRLHERAQALSSEPHDRIFAFLGLVDLPGFKPDSGLSMVDTLMSFSHHVISASNSLDIVPAGCGLRLPEFAGVPSWVPDWSPNQTPRALLHLGNINTDALWDAAKGFKHTCDNDFGSQELLVRGRVIGLVETCSPTRAEVVEQIGLENRTSWHAFMNGSSTVPWSPMKPLDMFRVILASISGGNDISQIFWTAEECVALCERHVILTDPLASDRDELNRTISPGEPDEDPDWGKFADIIFGLWKCRRLFQTSSGHYGLAWEDAEVGDAIAILHGLRVPVILKQTGSTGRYRVVCDASIEGIMFGEARTWEESEADDIILV
ncbi:Heterokaryon incompatibility protein 6, OR allele [Diplodia seriata]|uniref:Heterokaryon incompatibility protein 6, OR allele n=1 Tax=Diplodia seriata TaxID=420778 RepID=A0A1S8B9X7_9PEZI|nr:Heterokaryon incompatibility protein 6, OR allele [Diplodia seriata]